FLVDNSEVITNIGAEARKARDRYSYNDLAPSRAKLMELGQRYSAIPEADRSTVENMTVNLAQNVLTYESLVHYLDFARKDYSVEGSVLLTEIFSDRSTGLHTSDILARGDKLRLAIMALQFAQRDNNVSVDSEAQVFGRIFNDVDRAQALALFPPTSEEIREWYTPHGLLTKTLEPGGTLGPELKALAALETMARSTGNTLAFKQALNEFHASVVTQAKTRGEYGKVPMEVAFYKSKVFFYAQWLFVLGFLLLALSWLNLKNRTLHVASWAGVVVPWALLVIGITVRCIIRGRPPVTTLYETVLFITAVAVLVSLLMEYVNRQRIAIAIASLLGMLGMFLANKYELTNKQDTMPSLQAVLDTNFWLSTHVTIVTIGYAAGLLAAGIAHVYVLGKLFNFKREDKAFYRTITRMVYGVICFGLLTSFVGTVLGGIWANYSWGRFWGWDPKENGALMIVLCNLAILHARMGGYIRDIGIHLAAIFAGCVVAFSWWGVNLLGVGLHSYGFTSGIWRVLIGFWSFETAMIVAGAFVFVRGRLQGPSQPDPGQPEPSA
ncbi:MAG: cytochrome c biogenesis protein CcsA, partial [Candidatus Hydrogenedentes bacterium]|nr:cytochrome c biogenesis protein CcsA [Candidatus Hydrogenedentota bacterium]